MSLLLADCPPRVRAARRLSKPTGREHIMAPDDLIVSKTNLRGRILYANQSFIKISGYTEAQLMGAPHSLVRHPDMPRAIFQLLWERIGAGREIFAYVVNLCRNGDHYWVQAHVTPSFGPGGEVVGYHSNRRAPSRDAVRRAADLYGKLLRIEQQAPDRHQGLTQSRSELSNFLAAAGSDYDTFVSTL